MGKKEKGRGFFSNVERRVKSLSAELKEKKRLDDDIFTTPIHKKEEPTVENGTLVRGSVDTVFLILVLLISLFGVVMAFSASSVYAGTRYDDSTYFFKRHVLFLVLSVIMTAPFVIKARPWFWRFFAIGSYAGSVVLLLLVLVLGVVGKGAKRWIDLKVITIQPSEIAKMALILMLALVLTKYDAKLKSSQRHNGKFLYGVLVPGSLVALIVVLVMLEKHLSGVIIIGLLGLSVMFIGGMPKKWLGFIVLVGVTAVLLILLVSDYAQSRVDTWLNIEKADPLKEAWQTLQGLYAIGSGGFFGLGLGNSRQKFGYVSEPQNDFIFTIICEELGFVGAMAVIILFTLLVLRGFKIASRAPDKFTSLVVYGLCIKVALQVIFNIAVVTNSMPNTGISLPFFSSGGTSLALQIFEMGIVLNISRFSYHKQ